MSETNAAGAPAQVQLTVSQIKADLNNGLTRNDIQNKYGLSGKDVKDLFSHPKLKGLKTKVAPKFTLVDDEEEVVTPVIQEADMLDTQEEAPQLTTSDSF